MSTVIHSATVVSDGRAVEDGWIVFDDGLVSARGSGPGWRRLSAPDAEVVDAAGRILTPGFVDIHVHGGGGASFDDGVEAMSAGLAAHREHGTTRSVISLVSASLPDLTARLSLVRQLMSVDPLVLGSHLEGPFLSSEFKGAHDPSLLIAPGPDAVARLVDAAAGTLRQVTLAPELDGGQDAIRSFVREGAAVAVGHTAADYDQTLAAFDGGASILTHAFNGMAGIHHRAPGPVAAAIDSPGVTIELIADGTHVVPAAARILTAGAPGRIGLVTDAMAAAAAADGEYRLGALPVVVHRGVARLVEGGSIAGSTLTMDSALRFARAELHLSLPAAVDTVTRVPARALGVSGSYGSLSAGYPADAVLLDSALAVQRVWADGHVVTGSHDGVHTQRRTLNPENPCRQRPW